MRQRQIVFDIDGTLLDTEYAVLHSLQDTVRLIQNREIPLPALSFALGIPGEDALKQLSITDTETAQKIWDCQMSAYQDTIRIFDGMADVLSALADRKYLCGIVTSKTWEEYRHDFIPFDIHQYFSTTICADDTSLHKPDPEPLFRYMEVSGASAGQLLYIGDSIYDSQCAAEAGVEFALAGWGTSRTDIPFQYRLSTPQDILTLLKTIPESDSNRRR